jgi:hypothetical protein
MRKQCLSLLLGLLVIASPAVCQTGADAHLRANVVFKELTEKGIAVSDKLALKLPAPTMADGLDKAAQAKVLKALAGDDYPLDELLRASVVAPQIVKFRDLETTDDGRGRGVDLWFVAYGNLDLLTSKNLQGLGGGKGKVIQLADADLAKRGIKVKADASLEEAYIHGVGALLDRVQVSTTSHAIVSRTKDSVVLASRLDPRFAKDAEFPNLWRSITLKDNKEMLGDPQPYDSAAMYVKLTRLHEPPGAIFIEAHQVFVEPKKWFDAPNMLKSKLPIVIQSEVRAFRKDFSKLKAKE